MRGVFRFPALGAGRPRFDGAKPEQDGGADRCQRANFDVDAPRRIGHFAVCGAAARWQRSLTSTVR